MRSEMQQQGRDDDRDPERTEARSTSSSSRGDARMGSGCRPLRGRPKGPPETGRDGLRTKTEGHLRRVFAARTIRSFWSRFVAFSCRHRVGSVLRCPRIGNLGGGPAGDCRGAGARAPRETWGRCVGAGDRRGDAHRPAHRRGGPTAPPCGWRHELRRAALSHREALTWQSERRLRAPRLSALGGGGSRSGGPCRCGSPDGKVRFGDAVPASLPLPVMRNGTWEHDVRRLPSRRG